MDAQTIDGLMSELRLHLSRCPDVGAAYLFGSHAEGRAGRLSDIDIAVWVRGDFTEESLWRLEDALAADLRRVLRAEQVDLIVLNLAPLHVRYEVITHGSPLYSADDSARVDWESLTLQRYLDLAPYLAEYDRCFLTRVKEAFSETQRRQYQDTSSAVGQVHRRVR